MSHGLPHHLRGLLRPEAYPHPTGPIQVIQTHVSWVLLTGALAYKIKRPVRYDFIDLRSPERRAHFCREELRLNRRFAPELYVAVCVIREQNGLASLEGEGRVIEHAVCMRQFPREEELDRLLQSARIEPDALGEFGRSLARVHASLPRVAREHEYGTAEGVREQVMENFRQCLDATGRVGLTENVRALRALLSASLSELAALMGTRRAEGFVRECHGDLHRRNIVRRDGRLLAFDCMEFEPAFRWIDVADEVGFLCADLQARGFPLHEHAFLGGYLEASGDFEALRLIRLYKAHRALIRAKVSALSVDAEESVTELERAADECRAYITGAGSALARQLPRLILMSGLSGSGKTWLATRLAPELGAIHVRSDVERKRQAGIAASERSGSPPEQGLYEPSKTAHVYETLREAAGHALAGGYTVIVDATFNRRAERDRYRAFAIQLGVPMFVVHCQAAEAVLRRRIEERAARAADASDADLQVLQWQQEHLEVIDPSEARQVVDVDTTEDPKPSTKELVRRLSSTHVR